MADEPTAADLARGLLLGKWYLWPWEDVDQSGDLEEWKIVTVALCEELGVHVSFIDFKPKRVTVVVNDRFFPVVEDVQDAILQLERRRSLREST